MSAPIFIYHRPNKDAAGIKYWSANLELDGTVFQVLAHGEEHAKELVKKLHAAMKQEQVAAMEYARACAEADVPFGRETKS